MAHDPFEDPTPRVSKFANAYSFRGRLIMVEPTNVEHNVPKNASEPNGAKGDKVTANVTLMDGLGNVFACPEGETSDIEIQGPMYRGVWFNQDQIADSLLTPERTLRKRVLMRINTLNGSGRAKRGNPWIVIPATAEEKAAAAEILNQMTASQFEAPAPAAPAGNPFQKGTDVPF